MNKDIGFFYEKNMSVAQIVHKLSNDISMISSTLSFDIIFGLRGILFVIGKKKYFLISRRDSIHSFYYSLVDFSFCRNYDYTFSHHTINRQKSTGVKN